MVGRQARLFPRIPPVASFFLDTTKRCAVLWEWTDVVCGTGRAPLLVFYHVLGVAGLLVHRG
jgi:hypothetical protein